MITLAGPGRPVVAAARAALISAGISCALDAVADHLVTAEKRRP
jgi:hypothetical protein